MAYGRVRKKPRGVPAPYRSKLEYLLHKGPLSHLPFEPEKIPYTISTNYIPDFVNYDKGIIFEAKGRFEESSEAAKYVHFAKSNPLWTLVFIFQDPRKPMPGARRRKDGTKYSHAEWAEKQGFEWCCPRTIKGEWL